jgi:hypothetical protein
LEGGWRRKEEEEKEMITLIAYRFLRMNLIKEENSNDKLRV